MPHKCKICGKGFIGKENAINHVIKVHGIPQDKANEYVYHTNPAKEKERLRMQRMEDYADRVEWIRHICLNSEPFPAGPIYCPVCHANRSKSYIASLRDKDGRHSVHLCRDCYKTLAAERPQSVYHKSIYDGDYEGNK